MGRDRQHGFLQKRSSADHIINPNPAVNVTRVPVAPWSHLPRGQQLLVSLDNQEVQEGSTCNFPPKRPQVSDDLPHNVANRESLNFNMRTPVLPSILSHSGEQQNTSRTLKRHPEMQEDYEFLQKLGLEFGHSSSHFNFFAGEQMSSCDRNIKKGGGSSSPSYSRDLHEESFSNPNLLSILQNRDQH